MHGKRSEPELLCEIRYVSAVNSTAEAHDAVVFLSLPRGANLGGNLFELALTLGAVTDARAFGEEILVVVVRSPFRVEAHVRIVICVDHRHTPLPIVFRHF